jgi:HEAT repeat protein
MLFLHCCSGCLCNAYQKNANRIVRIETFLIKAVNGLDSVLSALRHSDFQVRWEMVPEVLAFGDDALLPLIDLLEQSQADADTDLQWCLAKILGSFHCPEAVLALVTLLETAEDEDLSDRVAQSLAGMGTDAVAALGQCLENPSRRWVAIKALTQIQQPEVVPFLLDAFPTVPADLRVSILEALDRFQAPAITAVLQQGLKDSSSEVRKVAIAGFASRSETYSAEERVQVIAPFLNDPVIEVADRTARALGRLGTDVAAIALKQKCCDPHSSPALQQTLIQALGWVGSKPALDGLTQIWAILSQQNPFPEALLQEILTSLSRVIDPEVQLEAAERVLAFLRSPILQDAVGLQCNAVYCLGRLAKPSMIPEIVGLLANPNYGVQLHAIAALKQISAEAAYQEIQRRYEAQNIPPELAEGLAIALREW